MFIVSVSLRLWQNFTCDELEEGMSDKIHGGAPEDVAGEWHGVLNKTQKQG